MPSFPVLPEREGIFAFPFRAGLSTKNRSMDFCHRVYRVDGWLVVAKTGGRLSYTGIRQTAGDGERPDSTHGFRGAQRAAANPRAAKRRANERHRMVDGNDDEPRRRGRSGHFPH